MKATTVDKFFRDVISYHRGEKKVVTPKGTDYVTVYDPSNPLGDTPALLPSAQSPICGKCALFEHDSETPFIEFHGATKPKITVILENVSIKEDEAGELAASGHNGRLKADMLAIARQVGVTEDEFRWISVTRCANRLKKLVNFKTKANHCRAHVVEDLLLHPPQFIIPVGTVALGTLCHKSNANDWGGRLLTYRGFPDDWITNKGYALPRPDPTDPESKRMITGHPLFGPMPTRDQYIPMMPIMSPRLVAAAQNPYVKARWMASIKRAIVAAKEGTPAMNYLRDWYNVVDDPDEIARQLHAIARMPKGLLCYDTETTGIKPWAEDASIVFKMFRWRDPKSGLPRSLGFPWNFKGLDFTNRVQEYIPDLLPYVLKALYAHDLLGHNLTFDILYTFANSPGADLDKLANAAKFDTWHMAYTLRQKPGTLGLEALAYDYAPDLAGYEEEMTLLIDLFYEEMHPEGKKGGHYANCPRDKWNSHLVPYVMGDVEVCYQAKDKIQAKLDVARTYKIPLADPNRLGKFREYEAPNRAFVYDKVMSPASGVLMKIMGRGMEVSLPELTKLEENYPNMIREAREKLRTVDERIVHWCEAKQNQDPKWELDLESKDQLKDILFDILDLPIQRLTKSGKKLFGDEEASYQGLPRETLLEYAALDKFTLNKLSVDHPQCRPLQEYRKIFKLYSTYVRPLRNIFTEGIDKNERTKERHLCKDGRIHAQFKLTGTRGGRLSCADPNLQQLPRDGDVKSMYISRFTTQGRDGCLYQGDLSQIELRLLAASCGDKTMVKAYFDDVDLHSLTASRIYRVPYEHFSKPFMQELQKSGKVKEAKALDTQRNVAKTVNFLTGYGGGAFGLQNTLAARQVYLSLEECEGIIERFFDSYPALKQHLQYYKWFIQESGVAVSILGRVRIFEEVFSDDREAISKALRAGCNHLIQSTASDMMLIALVVIEAMMREEGLESVLVSTVHDSLLIDSLRHELPKIHEIVNLVLNNFDQVLPSYLGDQFDTSWMIVPFTGDCEVGLNYLDSKKVPKDNIDWDELLYPKEKAA